MALRIFLDNKNFRRLLLGRVVTNTGDSLFYIAVMWLVFELAGSELFTGLAGFLALAPQGLQFLAGPVVDRVTTRRVLVVSRPTSSRSLAEQGVLAQGWWNYKSLGPPRPRLVYDSFEPAPANARSKGWRHPLNAASLRAETFRSA
jgi:hypothetical protein